MDENNWVVAGGSPIEYSMSIEDVVNFVESEYYNKVNSHYIVVVFLLFNTDYIVKP